MAEQQKNPKAVPSLVMGIIAFVVPVIGFVTGILGIIFGAKGLKIAKEQNGNGHGMSVVGLVLSIIGLVGQLFTVLLAIVGMIAYFGVLDPSAMMPEMTSFSAPITGYGSTSYYENGEVTIMVELTNNYGQNIAIDTSLESAVGEGDCLSVTDFSLQNPMGQDTTVPDGVDFVLTWTCTTEEESGDFFSADLGFSYVVANSEIVRTHYGAVYTTLN